jgi:hypothetical protein
MTNCKTVCVTAFFAMAVSLSACTSSGNAPPAPAPAPAPQVAQTNIPQAGVTQTKVTETTTIDDDGTVTTETTTVSMGVNTPTAPAVAVAAKPAANAGLPGQWTMVSSSSGATCNVALYGAPNAVNGKAASDCPGGFILNGVSAWNYSGGVLSLIKGGSPVLSLNQLGPNRFDGQATGMGITTTISLYR